MRKSCDDGQAGLSVYNVKENMDLLYPHLFFLFVESCMVSGNCSNINNNACQNDGFQRKKKNEKIEDDMNKFLAKW